MTLVSSILLNILLNIMSCHLFCICDTLFYVYDPPIETDLSHRNPLYPPKISTSLLSLDEPARRPLDHAHRRLYPSDKVLSAAAVSSREPSKSRRPPPPTLSPLDPGEAGTHGKGRVAGPMRGRWRSAPAAGRGREMEWPGGARVAGRLAGRSTAGERGAGEGVVADADEDGDPSSRSRHGGRMKLRPHRLRPTSLRGAPARRRPNGAPAPSRHRRLGYSTHPTPRRCSAGRGAGREYRWCPAKASAPPRLGCRLLGSTASARTTTPRAAG
jgi:hypothetical protein